MHRANGLLLALMLWLPGAVSACVCDAAYAGLADRLAHTRLVMVVRVESTELIQPRDVRYGVRATFRVVETLKGEAGGVHALLTGSGSCSLPLQASEYYLIASNAPQAETPVSVCGGSRPLNGLPDMDLQLDSIRRHLAEGKPIHRCDDWLVVPPPPKGEADECLVRQSQWHEDVLERLERQPLSEMP